MRVSTLTGPNRLVVDFAIPAGTAATPTPVTTPVAPAGSTQSVGSQPPQETGAATPADTGPTSTPSTNPDRPAAAHPGSGDDANDGPSTGVLTAGGVGLVALGAGGYLLFRRLTDLPGAVVAAPVQLPQCAHRVGEGPHGQVQVGHGVCGGQVPAAAGHDEHTTTK